MNTKRNADELLIVCLAAGMSMTRTGAKCGLSLRTVQRRMKDWTFNRRVLDARQALVARTTGQLALLGPVAVKALRQALRDNDGKARLAAARTVLRTLFLAHQRTTADYYQQELLCCMEQLKEGTDDSGTYRRLCVLAGRPVPPVPDDDPAHDPPPAAPPAPNHSTGPPPPWIVTDGREPPAAPPPADGAAAPPPAGRWSWDAGIS
jgi:hypothetical protein